MHSIKHDQRGIAHVVLIGIIVVVVAAVGFAGWRVMQSKKGSNDSVASTVSKEVSKQAAADCKKQIDDKDLCKFLTSWAGNTKFTVVSTDASDGNTSKTTIKVDGKNTYIKTEGSSSIEMISMGDTTYTKAGNTWWKKTSKPSENPAADIPAVDSSTFEFDDPGTSADAPKYKKVGKEPCGAFTCFKYELVDPASGNTSDHIWFDDSKYLVRKLRTVSKEGSVSEMTFSYENSDVTVPSPVKELGENQYILPGETEPTTLPNYNGLTQ